MYLNESRGQQLSESALARALRNDGIKIILQMVATELQAHIWRQEKQDYLTLGQQRGIVHLPSGVEQG